jgi:hypothetical protein
VCKDDKSGRVFNKALSEYSAKLSAFAASHNSFQAKVLAKYNNFLPLAIY